MNHLFRSDLLWHAAAVHAWLAGMDAQASIDILTFRLEIRTRNRYYRFFPRFGVAEGVQMRYVELPDKDVRGFAGWLPYFNKRWPIGSGKFAFKGFCREQGLPTPGMRRNPEAGMRDFLVKHDQSSFGKGMRGPFTSYDPADADQALQDGGYYEQFVPGRMLKAWYWEDRLASLEVFPMPTVTGDGKSSVQALIERAIRTRIGANWEALRCVARYQGMTLETVLSAGQVALADFRYASPLVWGYTGSVNTLERSKDSPLLKQMKEFGPVLWHGIPEGMRAATLYVVDAIADADDKPWLLEMNCNPAVHPEVYPLMLERLFGPRDTVEEPDLEAVAPVPPAVALPRQSRTPAAPPALDATMSPAPLQRWLS